MADTGATPGALSDLFVVELGDAAQSCGKLLADMGATVIKVEPPTGAAARHRGPYVDGHEGDLDASLHFWTYNTSKQSVTLDLSDARDRERLLLLVARADVLLEDFEPGHLPSMGLGYDDLSILNPRLVYASVTPFGQTGPLRTWKGSDMVAWAMGGAMELLGYTDRSTPPLVPQGDLSQQLAGQWLSIGVLAALAGRDLDGHGQHVDVSMQEVVAITADGYATAPFEYEHRVMRRDDLANMVAAANGGYIVAQMLNITDDKWQQFKEWLTEQGAIGDLIDLPPSEWESNRPLVVKAVERVSKNFSTDELCEIGQRFGFTWMKVNSARDLFVDRQLRARGFFRQVEHPELGRTVEYPGPGAEWNESGWEIRRRPPLLGEDSDAWFEPDSGAR